MLDFDTLYGPEKEKITAEFSAKHQRMLEMSVFFAKALREYRSKGWHTHATIWNVAFFVNMTAHDVSVLVLQIANESGDWSRKLAARHAALAMYETTEDMSAMLGKDFRSALGVLGVLDELKTTLNDAKQPIDAFWKAHAQTLKEIRVATVAHRDQDSLKLYDTILGIDVNSMFGIGLQYGRMQNELGPAIQTILTRSAQVKPPELV